MKIITLKQPWATLIAENIKKYEFRSWKTNYRGELLIHAGKSIDKTAIAKFEHLNLEYPTSKILAKVIIEDCIELNEENNAIINSENLEVYGNKKRTGYAWKIGQVEKLNINDKIKGKLGIWNYDIVEK